MSKKPIKLVINHAAEHTLPMLYPHKNPIDNAMNFSLHKAQGELKSYLLSEEYHSLIESLKKEVEVCLVPVTSQSTWEDFWAQCVDHNVLYLTSVSDDYDPGPTFFDCRHQNQMGENEPLLDLISINAEAECFKNNADLCQKLLADNERPMNDYYEIEHEIINHEKKQTLDALANRVYDYNTKWGELLPLTMTLEIYRGRVMANLTVSTLDFGDKVFERRTRKAGSSITLDLAGIPDGDKDSTIIISKPPTSTKRLSTGLINCGLFGLAITGLSLAASLSAAALQSENATRQITP